MGMRADTLGPDRAVELGHTRDNWEHLGATDPLWAVLTRRGMRGGRWDVREFFATGRAEIAALMAGVERLQRPVGRDAALDFGCGVGRLTQPLADHFRTVIGVDIAESMLAEARRLNTAGDRCVFVRNDRPDLRRYPNESFDLVYTSLVLQHLPPGAAMGYVREFARLLRPGGLVVFSLPVRLSNSAKGRALRLAPAGILALYRRLRRRPHMPMNPVPRDEVLAVLAEAALTVECVEADDTSGGRAWRGFRYAASKAAVASDAGLSRLRQG
jgi:SAM-dependent methyltransferase